MSDQPKALRIAERCESLASLSDAYSEEAYREAAAELRRQHAALQSAADSLAQMALDRNDKELADLALKLRAAARGATE